MIWREAVWWFLLLVYAYFVWRNVRELVIRAKGTVGPAHCLVLLLMRSLPSPPAAGDDFNAALREARGRHIAQIFVLGVILMLNEFLSPHIIPKPYNTNK